MLSKVAGRDSIEHRSPFFVNVQGLGRILFGNSMKSYIPDEKVHENQVRSRNIFYSKRHNKLDLKPGSRPRKAFSTHLSSFDLSYLECCAVSNESLFKYSKHLSVV